MHESTQFVNHLIGRFGGCVCHIVRFPNVDAVFEYLGSLSFASGSGQDVSLPYDHMEVRVLCPPQPPVEALIGGRLTVEETNEIREKAKAKGAKIETLEVSPKTQKAWWQFWK